MKWLIAADSSCDLKALETGSPEIEFRSVPFTVTLDNEDYQDDDKLNVETLVDSMEKSASCRTACPAVAAWVECFEQADQVIALTISSKLSGSYSSAMVARQIVLEKHPEKRIEVVDSLSTGPKLVLLAHKALHMIKYHHPFERVAASCHEIASSAKTLFTLSSFQNLVRNGRVGKLTGFIAGKLGIRAIGEGSEEGTIRLRDKIRGDLNTLKQIVETMGRQGFSGGKVVICHCLNEKLAEKLSSLIYLRWQHADVQILPTRGLDSVYAERNGLIISY